MNTRKLLLKLSKQFPKRYSKIYQDYVGLMTGKLPEEVHKILLCLDFDGEVLPYAKKEKPDLILTHHPFIYGTRGFVLSHNPIKASLCDELDKLGIPVYSMHTNFDRGEGGMNDALAAALELEDIKAPELEPMMRGGKLKKEMELEEFAQYVKDKLCLDYALLVAAGKKKVSSCAIIGGGGSRDWPVAKEAGYDIYISGDMSHRVRRDIIANGYNYLDIPHEVEKIFMPTMKKILLNIDPSLDVVVIDHEKMPKVI